MKYLYLILTLAFHYFIHFFLSRFFSNPGFLLSIFGFVLIIGLVIQANPAVKNMQIKQAGWGLFYGSLFVMALFFGIFIVLA